MVSVVGRTTAAATTDRDGRYTLRELPYGPYILSVHSRGYFKSRGRTVQLTTSKVSIPEIQLQLASARKVPASVVGSRWQTRPAVQATQLAGFGLERSRRPSDDSAVGGVRGGKRASKGKLRGACGICRGASSRTRRPTRCGRRATSTESHDGSAAVRPRRLCPIAFFSDLPLSGQLNLMTIESFDRPGEIFAEHASAQRGVCLGQHTGCRRRVVDAGRDDAGRSGVVDRRRLLQVDRIDEPRVRAGPRLQHAAL